MRHSRHCEERSDAAIQSRAGLLRCARNDGDVATGTNDGRCPKGVVEPCTTPAAPSKTACSE
ncbi:hypothetical protein DF286_13170 [Sphingosinicella humi]|uniref:Uncharacterized protein n=1 Tax=Allosphingosinicella humi TaxID=2068657 RepID=A0A2U2J613_9SPHN|nr:hypothetical protein DF286_13170 [Sphingosinicella humi]